MIVCRKGWHAQSTQSNAMRKFSVVVEPLGINTPEVSFHLDFLSASTVKLPINAYTPALPPLETFQTTLHTLFIITIVIDPKRPSREPHR